jgi:hypothetical protein
VQVVPGIGFTGDVLIQYVVSDGAGGSATGQLTVHVTSVFVPPPAPPVVPPIKPVVVVGPTAPSKPAAPSHVESATVVVTIVPAHTSVTLDPASADAGLGAITIMSVTQPTSGAHVEVIGGKLVVSRTSNYVGTTTFNYTGMAKNGTEVRVVVIAHVLGETATAPSLPFTGANVELFAFIGAILLVTGTFAVFIGGRRRRTQPEPS